MPVYERLRILSHMKSLVEAVKDQATDWYQKASDFLADLEKIIIHMSKESFAAAMKRWEEIVKQGPKEIQSESFVF